MLWSPIGPVCPADIHFPVGEGVVCKSQDPKDLAALMAVPGTYKQWVLEWSGTLGLFREYPARLPTID
jgi:hypothetical protein